MSADRPEQMRVASGSVGATRTETEPDEWETKSPKCGEKIRQPMLSLVAPTLWKTYTHCTFSQERIKGA